VRVEIAIEGATNDPSGHMRQVVLHAAPKDLADVAALVALSSLEDGV
jgi:hypothetical protein